MIQESPDWRRVRRLAFSLVLGATLCLSGLLFSEKAAAQCTTCSSASYSVSTTPSFETLYFTNNEVRVRRVAWRPGMLLASALRKVRENRLARVSRRYEARSVTSFAVTDSVFVSAPVQVWTSTESETCNCGCGLSGCNCGKASVSSFATEGQLLASW